MKKDFQELQKNNGSTIEWTLDKTGRLTITGEGNIPDYYRDDPPWQDQVDSIEEILIEEGITGIGARSFYSIPNLKRLSLPASLVRIKAMAFCQCRSLETVGTASDKDFKYIYDSRPFDKEREIKFGMRAFYNTPWALRKWGPFYIVEDEVLTCFSADPHLIIPDGIHTLHAFALADVEASTVLLPGSLQRIGNFSFSRSSIKELILPDSLLSVEEHAFADSCLERIEFPRTMAEITGELAANDNIAFKSRKRQIGTRKERVLSKKGKYRYITVKVFRKYTPIPDIYRVSLKNPMCYSPFKEVVITRRKPVHHIDGSGSGVYGRNRIRIGESVCRRIKNGSILSCVVCDKDRVLSVDSFAWDNYEQKAFVRKVVPESKDGEIFVKSMHIEYVEDLGSLFRSDDGRELEEKGGLGYCNPGLEEDWFRSKYRDFPNAEDGKLEIELLKLFLENHPEKISGEMDPAGGMRDMKGSFIRQMQLVG